MSFGFSVGDFLAVYELISKVYQEFTDAPKHFHQISKELRCVEKAVRPIENLSTGDLSPEQQEKLTDIQELCQSTVKDTQELVDDFRECLDTQETNTRQGKLGVWQRSEGFLARIRGRGPKHQSTLPSGDLCIKKEMRKIWKRVQFDSADVSAIRSRMTLCITLSGEFSQNLKEHKEDKRRLQQKKQEILKWLTPICYDGQQSDFIRQRQEGTGQWLLDSREYRHWVETKKEALFCPGIPGAGKTIITSIVIDDLKRLQRADASIGICYVYLNFRQKDEQKLEHLLSSLIKQLAQTQPGLCAKVESLHIPAEEKTRPSITQLVQASCAVVRDFSRTFIVVDALDECQANGCRESFILELLKFVSDLEANVFTTSRALPAITAMFEHAAKIEIRASNHDIARYIDGNSARLPNFVARDSALQAEIKDTIVRDAKGMFLLARLHFDSIHNTTSRKGVRLALRKFARGSDAYDSAYDDAMARIKGQLSCVADLALRTLFWITYSERYLTALELRHALGVEPGTTEFDDDNLPDLDLVVSSCCGLVTVDEKRDVIRLVHYTTQEYFDRTGASCFPNAQLQITQTCLTYLSFETFESGPCPSESKYQQRVSTFPLYEYASRYWGKHACLASDDQSYCITFLNETSKVAACAQSLFKPIYIDERSGRHERDVNGLHLTAFFGLLELIKSLIEKNDPNPPSLYRETPVYYAISQGHVEVVKLFLEKGLDVDATVGSWPLLVIAVDCEQEEIVHLLLGRGANIEAMTLEDCGGRSEDTQGMTALACAADNEDKAMVRLLLQRGANIDVKYGAWDTSPLFKACLYRRMDMVDLLLEHKADVDILGGFHYTPLGIATQQGQMDLFRLLIAKGANPDIDLTYRNPLQIILHSMVPESRKKLKVNQGVFSEYSLRSPWYTWNDPTAVIDRSTKIDMIRILLDKCCDLSADGAESFSPLHLAIHTNDEEVVRMLLEDDTYMSVESRVINANIGVDVRTPLMVAVDYSDEKSMYSFEHSLSGKPEKQLSKSFTLYCNR
ncbi:hypothetical protein F4808DRAFT_409655 [Astrocystis sublimbata]|nr:hypothetical protein F4808DRAFT_409655 [Astrocystis sublimbata]